MYISEIYKLMCEEKEALARGTSLKEEQERQGYSIRSIALDNMWAIPSNGQILDDEEFAFVKATIEFTPIKECEIDCPFACSSPSKHKGRGFKQWAEIEKCSKEHPNVRCIRGHDIKTKIFYPFLNVNTVSFRPFKPS